MQVDDDTTISALADRHNREILGILSQKELSSQEIATKLEIPTSTVYRKIKQLEELQLIKKIKVVRTLDGLDKSYYRGLVSQVEIKFVDGKTKYHIHKIQIEDKLVRLWQKFKE